MTSNHIQLLTADREKKAILENKSMYGQKNGKAEKFEGQADGSMGFFIQLKMS